MVVPRDDVCKKDKGGSGDTEDDMKQRVINAMYHHLNKQKTDAISDDEVEEAHDNILDEANDNEVTDGEDDAPKDLDSDKLSPELPAPSDWLPKNWMAWILHGCMAPKMNRLELLDPDDKPKGEAKSRKQRRKDEAESKELERKQHHGIKRMSLQEHMGLQQLAVQRDRKSVV